MGCVRCWLCKLFNGSLLAAFLIVDVKYLQSSSREDNSGSDLASVSELQVPNFPDRY